MNRILICFTLTCLTFLPAFPTMAADNGLYLDASVGQSTLRTGDALEEVELSGEDVSFEVFAGVPFRSFATRAGLEYFDIEDTDDVYMYSISASFTC